jgi:hypothetical protein
MSTEDQFWQPWQWKVGDRVRVRLSGECQLEYHDLSPAKRIAGICNGHLSAEDGLTGTVVEYGNSPDIHAFAVKQGHPYSVQWDRNIRTGRFHWGGSNYAAAELEPNHDQPR